MIKRFISVILIVLFILLYEHFFITSTMEQAMKKEEDSGRAFITTIIDDKNAVTFTDNGAGVIRATTLSKGAFGWRVKDQMEIAIPIDSKEGFVEKGETLDLKSGKSIYLLMGVLLGPDIAEIEIHADGGSQEVRPDIATSLSGTRIFLWVGDEKLEDITYRAKAYSGDVLYEK
jgi:hypothetical protein